jgi:hypothetical protein
MNIKTPYFRQFRVFSNNVFKFENAITFNHLVNIISLIGTNIREKQANNPYSTTSYIGRMPGI